jgi:hypothetical protein
MFLEEMKHWATYELALYALNKDNLKAINNRVGLFLFPDSKRLLGEVHGTSFSSEELVLFFEVGK